MSPTLLLYFRGSGSGSPTAGTGPSYFHINVDNATNPAAGGSRIAVDDPDASNFRIAVNDLDNDPALASIMVETL